MKGKIPAGTEFWNQTPLGPGLLQAFAETQEQ